MNLTITCEGIGEERIVRNGSPEHGRLHGGPVLLLTRTGRKSGTARTPAS